MNQSKKHSGLKTLSAVISLGAVAGMRARLAPALFSRAASSYRKADFGDSLFASDYVPAVLGTLAVGELVGDKLPRTPNRTEIPGLAARIVSGAVVGGAVSAGYKKSVPAGIALGALAAVAAAYAGQNVRRAVSNKSGISSPLLGAVEDLIAVGIAAAALRNSSN
jgi:uncharacterized membrane protein